jgi:uncharacterized protein YegL
MNGDNRYFNNFDFGDWDNSHIKSYRKVPMCLLVDTSGSMAAKDGTRLTKIEELNNNIHGLIDFIKKDPKANRICDLSIISFGGKVNVISGYDNVENIRFENLKPTGATPLGEAVFKAIELLDLRRHYYRENEIEHYKPVLVMMTEGAPTDDYKSAASSLSAMVIEKQVKVFPVGIGKGFEKVVLSEFSPIIEPKQIKDTSGFSLLFRLLSASTTNPNDDSLERWFNDEF